MGQVISVSLWKTGLLAMSLWLAAGSPCRNQFRLALSPASHLNFTSVL